MTVFGDRIFKEVIKLQLAQTRNSLPVQWLRLCASTAGATGSIPREIRSHILCFTPKKKEKELNPVQLSVTPGTTQSMEFFRPEYCSGQPFPFPGNLPNPGIKPKSPALQVDSLPAESPGKPKNSGVGGLLSLLLQIFPT